MHFIIWIGTLSDVSTIDVFSMRIRECASVMWVSGLGSTLRVFIFRFGIPSRVSAEATKYKLLECDFIPVLCNRGFSKNVILGFSTV